MTKASRTPFFNRVRGARPYLQPRHPRVGHAHPVMLCCLRLQRRINRAAQTNKQTLTNEPLCARAAVPRGAGTGPLASVRVGTQAHTQAHARTATRIHTHEDTRTQTNTLPRGYTHAHEHRHTHTLALTFSHAPTSRTQTLMCIHTPGEHADVGAAHRHRAGPRAQAVLGTHTHARTHAHTHLGPHASGWTMCSRCELRLSRWRDGLHALTACGCYGGTQVPPTRASRARCEAKRHPRRCG